jgi:hypothetical protein
MLLKKLFLLVLASGFIHAVAQKKDVPDSLHQLVLAARYHSGFIFAHSVHVQNTKGTHPNGFELEYSHVRTDIRTRSKFNCFPRTGFSFTYVDFHKELLGRSYSVSYFLEPNFKIGSDLKLLLRASIGLSYLTNPHDSIKNPLNQSYSGYINSFLQLGFGLSYPVSNHLSVYAMGNFFHNSNGGFKQPNSGVNYVNASIGMQYYRYSTHFPAYNIEKDTSWKHQRPRIDVSLFYSPKGGYNADSTPHRKLLLGVDAHIAKQISNIDALTAGAEIYYDEALRTMKETFVFDTSSNVLAGLLIGHRFLLNRFIFSQELGFYVYKRTATYNELYNDIFHTVYHRWGLSYNIRKRWSIGITLLAHKQIADFVDGRVIYRLQ